MTEIEAREGEGELICVSSSVNNFASIAFKIYRFLTQPHNGSDSVNGSLKNDA